MITYDLDMTTTEVKPITLQVLDLQASETVSSATATHTPPSGSPLTITPSISTPYVNMVFGPFAVAGHHFVDVQATGGAGTPSKPVARYMIRVK
jgi:hypothetical protein